MLIILNKPTTLSYFKQPSFTSRFYNMFTRLKKSLLLEKKNIAKLSRNVVFIDKKNNASNVVFTEFFTKRPQKRVAASLYSLIWKKKTYLEAFL